MSDEPFVTRVTINPVLEPDLFEEMDRVPKGYKATRLVSLAAYGLQVINQAKLNGSGPIVAPSTPRFHQESTVPTAPPAAVADSTAPAAAEARSSAPIPQRSVPQLEALNTGSAPAQQTSPASAQGGVAGVYGHAKGGHRRVRGAISADDL